MFEEGLPEEVWGAVYDCVDDELEDLREVY